MAIPDGQLYHDGTLGAGRVATTERATVNGAIAAEEVGFGKAVGLKDNQAVVATAAPIYGIAVRRSYTRFYDFKEGNGTDAWQKGETIGVLREGTVAVQISEDVDAGKAATVASDGTFKPAGSADKAVGIFLTSGNKGGTANLQIRIDPAYAPASTASAAGTSTGSGK